MGNGVFSWPQSSHGHTGLAGLSIPSMLIQVALSRGHPPGSQTAGVGLVRSATVMFIPKEAKI